MKPETGIQHPTLVSACLIENNTIDYSFITIFNCNLFFKNFLPLETKFRKKLILGSENLFIVLAFILVSCLTIL